MFHLCSDLVVSSFHLFDLLLWFYFCVWLFCVTLASWIGAPHAAGKLQSRCSIRSVYIRREYYGARINKIGSKSVENQQQAKLNGDRFWTYIYRDWSSGELLFALAVSCSSFLRSWSCRRPICLIHHSFIYLCVCLYLTTHHIIYGHI